jgi:hypothetical protein
LAVIPDKICARIPDGLFSGFLRGFFGKSSGNPEAFPKTSRTLPEENRPRTMEIPVKKSKPLFRPEGGDNGKKQNFRIRYRTLKSGPGQPLNLFHFIYQ